MIRIYLDQKDWIHLARIFYKIENSDKDQSLLKKIQSKIRSNEIIFPLSEMHFIESLKASNLGRRSRLAEVFWAFSNGLVLKHRSEILPLEILNSLNLLIQSNQKAIAIDPIKKGLLSVIGSNTYLSRNFGFKNEEIDALEWNLQKKENWIEFLKFPVESERKVLLSKITEISNKDRLDQEFIRAKLIGKPKEIQERLFYGKFFLDYQGYFLEALEKINRSKEFFYDIGYNGIRKLISETPIFDVKTKLIEESLKQKSRKIDSNDIYDIHALCLAIPYCDIVITEAYWQDLSSKSKLSEKYDTTILSKVTELEEQI